MCVFDLKHTDLLTIDVVQHTALRKPRELRKLHRHLGVRIEDSPSLGSNGHEKRRNTQRTGNCSDQQAQTQP